jgi:glycosyltransferase involved in cell wall biosynthesis
VFLGDRPDARALMGSASVFVQASAYEGYGRTLIEAALAKVPIVTTDVGLVGTVFQNGVDVLAVPVGDTTAFAEALIRLIEETTLRIQLSVNAELSARTHLASFGDLPARVADDLQRVGSGT